MNSERTLRISIGSFGRFHTFDLATQMQRLGVLGSLYTAYPRWKVDNLPTQQTHCFPWWMLATTAAARVGRPAAAVHRSLNRRMIKSFDRWVAARLLPCDVYHCLSSTGLHTHRVARQRYGALTVCDRGSSHIV